jgi:hypothetical protein
METQMTMESQVAREFDGYLVEVPGILQRLAWPSDEEPQAAAAAALVAEVVAAFAPLLRPLSIDVLLRAHLCDPYVEVPLARPFWFAATAAAESVEPSTEGAIQRRVDSLTPDAIEALINDAAAAEKLGPDVVWTWDEIRIYAVEVRLPAALARRDVLSLRVTGGDIGVEVEHRNDGAWIRSTQSPSDSPPFELSMTGQFPKLNITTCWSLWTPGGPGEADLNGVIATLLARGWIRCS